MSRRRWLLGALGALVAGGALVGAAGLSALDAADDLERARARLTEAQDVQTTTDASVTALRQAEDDVQAANETLDRWHVDVVAAVPVLGRSWDVERAVARTAQHVIAGADVLADGLTTVRAKAGGVDLAALAGVRDELAGPVQESARALDELEATSAALTPAKVGDARTDALDALAPAVETLGKAQQGLGAVSGLLGESGPRRLLVMLQNNAELRGAGGYAASFATGRLEDGRITLDPLQDVFEVADSPAEATEVPAPEEYLQDFGHLAANTTQWRSWNMSPHVPDSALVGARIAGALLEHEPDVVVLLDVPAMGALAALGGGGVELPDGRTVSPDELTQALLVDAYAQGGSDLLSQGHRRAELQAAATTAVTRLLAGDVPASEAVRTLAQLAEGRHLAVWSAQPEEQEALEALGAAGTVTTAPGADLSHVSVNNIGANKLDLYVEREVEVDVTVHEDRAQVVQRVRFTNRAPEGLVPYVAGYERPGLVVSRVELSVPPQAADVSATVQGQPWPGTTNWGPDRGRLATRLELPPQASAELEVRYDLPTQDGDYDLLVVPQALAADASLELSVQAADGERLVVHEGPDGSGDGVQYSAPLSETVDLRVSLYEEPRSRWERFKDWWNSPVSVG